MPAARARLAAAATAAGLPMLSHDDATLEDRALYRGLGAGICEFPMAEAVAADARAAGEAVVMGAPNVVRGGSHLGWASAAPLAERGLVTVLASDYHWPALLEAPFAMARRGRMDLAAAWALVSGQPGRGGGAGGSRRAAAGAARRRGGGRSRRPAVVAVFCAGRLAHLTAAGRRGWAGGKVGGRHFLPGPASNLLAESGIRRAAGADSRNEARPGRIPSLPHLPPLLRRQALHRRHRRPHPDRGVVEDRAAFRRAGVVADQQVDAHAARRNRHSARRSRR